MGYHALRSWAAAAAAAATAAIRYTAGGPCVSGDNTLQCLRKIELQTKEKGRIRDRMQRLAVLARHSSNPQGQPSESAGNPTDARITGAAGKRGRVEDGQKAPYEVGEADAA